MRSDRISFALALLLPLGCKMVTEGTGDGSESSSSEGTDDEADDVDPADDTADDNGLEGTSEDDGPDTTGDTENDSSSAGDEAEDDSTGDSSTGEPEPPDWALEFDGNSRALKIGDGGVYEWTTPNFTIETWVEIKDTEATGIIFASENPESTAGWAFYLHPDWHTFAFSYLDSDQINRLTMGPTVEEIGEGWHHLAATKDGDTIFMHVDGVAVVADDHPDASLSSAGGTVWTIGGTATEDPTSFWRLKDTVIDDIRISEFSRYAGNFDPPTIFEDDCGAKCTINLILPLDEGDGIIAEDALVSDVEFMIEDPEWVPGYGG